MGSRWILVSLLTEQQEFQRAQAVEARAAAARAGYRVEIAYAENDLATQLKQLQAQLSLPEAQRPQAMVVETTGSVGFERVARAALEAGVGWVVVGGSSAHVVGLCREFTDRLVCSVAADGVVVGKLLASLVRALLPAGGDILVVEGPSLIAASLHRRRGLEEGLAGAPVRIVKTITADWTVAGAERGVTSWLSRCRRARPWTSSRRPRPERRRRRSSP
jgi:ABC-type sugar transport system substrate-binding protein